MGPALLEMVENTAPHPEAPAHGNSLVNDASEMSQTGYTALQTRWVCVQQLNAIPSRVSVDGFTL